MTRVSVLVLNWNGLRWLRDCFDALARQAAGDIELDTWLIDNGSTDESVAMVRSHYPSVKVLQLQHNIGFGAAYNRAVAATTSPLLVFLNNDTVVQSGWLTALVREVKSHPDAAAVGSKLVFMHAPHLVNHAGGALTVLGAAFDRGFGAADNSARSEAVNTGCATGAAVLVRREAFLAVDGFDERYFAYFEDADLCWRFWLRGYRVRYVPEAVVRHAYGGSSRRGRASLFRIENCQANRLHNMLKHLEVSTLAWAIPASLAYDGLRVAEAARRREWAVVAAVKRGSARFTGQLRGALPARRHVQATRVRSDGELFELGVLVGLREAAEEWGRLGRLRTSLGTDGF